MDGRPPLPPRTNTQPLKSYDQQSESEDSDNYQRGRSRKDTIHLTPYEAIERRSKYEVYPYSNEFSDPRSSSTQSLRPIRSATEGQRKLLLIYIHGFMGNETSFKSFPAHVHNLLSVTLAETHVVHSKIYPRYKSRKHISYARDDFSNWLAPHETLETDVILVGHSLGGILGAEVVLLPSHTPGSHDLFQHRILGLIAFDTPFLGMHPGVVSTGIASLFKSPEPKPVEVTENPPPYIESSTSVVSDSSSILSDPLSPMSDPNFNPAYPNDVHLPIRKNKLEQAWYFWNKHSKELLSATRSYVTSHLEFGGCLADYPGLNRRYNAIRSLEDVDEMSKQQAPNGRIMKRVRFVNYYTASTGTVKERSPSESPSRSPSERNSVEMRDLSPRVMSEAGTSRSPSPMMTPRLSLEEHRDDQVIAKEIEELSIDQDVVKEQESPTVALSSVTTLSERAIGPSGQNTDEDVETDDLPAVPDLPEPPPEFDATKFAAKDALKLAQTFHERQVKAFESAKKDREKSLKDREKVITNRRKVALKSKQQAEKLSKQKEVKEKKEKLKRSATLNPEDYDKQLEQEAKQNVRPAAPPKKQRDRKFCALPSKDQRTGLRDPTWIRVYMEGMDEVVAHTSMFIISDTYAKMVGDTASRIEEWINEDATRRAVIGD